MAATFTDFNSDMSGHNRYIGDISPILGDFFRLFLQTTFVCKNRVGKARHPKYRRYIATFSSMVVSNSYEVIFGYITK